MNIFLEWKLKEMKMNKKFRIQFVGSGTMFSKSANNFHNNALLLAPDRKEGLDSKSPVLSPRFLIDCGSDIRHAMEMAKIPVETLTDIYISHLHDDHAGGLEGVGFYTFFNPTVHQKPNLYFSSYLRQAIWQKLSPSMKSLSNQSCDLETYFNVRSIPKNHTFDWEKCEFTCVQQIHIMDEYTSVPSFGLKITLPGNGKVIYYTSDTKYFPDQMIEFYNEADIIFQDCEVLYFNPAESVKEKPNDKKDLQKHPIKSRVHAHYSDLKSLPPKIKAKMYLMHCQDNWKNYIDPVADGFLGVVERGQTIEL